MLNEGEEVQDPHLLKVLDGIELSGRINIADAALLANVRAAMVRQYPQVKPQANHPALVALVGSGPSLKHTETELRDLYFAGAKIATVNGAYHWCLERNLRPSVQIVMDGRASNARFVEPRVPQCQYVLASQCAPETWDAVEGRENVWMFHAMSSEADGMKEILDRHFAGQWYGVAGGTTVVTRALYLLRMLGFLRYELFGVDSCWMGTEHHAFPQVENENDKWVKVTAAPGDATGPGRTFIASPWHLKQAEDFLQLIRVNGDHFLMNVHGDGLIAYLLQSSADIVGVEEVAAVA